jgi:hypothetical protein
MYLHAACTAIGIIFLSCSPLPACPTAITQPARDGRSIYSRAAPCTLYVRVEHLFRVPR